MSGNSDKTILVAGISGKQGGAVARRLQWDGWRVRGLTRKPDAEALNPLRELGIEVVGGDLTDQGSLTGAMSGAYGVFAMATPFEKGPENEIAQGNTLADVAASAGVRHYVYSSVGSANHKTGIPHFESKARIEEHLKELNLPHTVVRPVYFMENLIIYGVQSGDEGLTLPVPLPSTTPVQMIAVDDVAAIVGLVFAQPDHYIGKAFDIAGDELTFPKAAATLTQATGETVTYVEIPWEAVRERSEDLYLMFRWLAHKGYRAKIDDVRKMHPEMLDLGAWLQRGGAKAFRQRWVS
jgi:uncharacterized protein YbjT (DUF2867 family)